MYDRGSREVKASVVPIVIRGLHDSPTPDFEWLQQIQGTTSEISIHDSADLGAAKYETEPSNVQVYGRGTEFELRPSGKIEQS